MLDAGLDYRRGFSYITTIHSKSEIIGQKKLLGNGGDCGFAQGVQGEDGSSGRGYYYLVLTLRTFEG